MGQGFFAAAEIAIKISLAPVDGGESLNLSYRAFSFYCHGVYYKIIEPTYQGNLMIFSRFNIVPG